jgi:putative acetyltransferase
MIKIRPEKECDWKSIHEVTELAFAGKPYSDGDEPDLVDRLREIGALTLSLVALDSGSVVGHIAFSPASITSDSGPWYALGPVSVTPERQGEGIGSLLIEEGLSEIANRGALGCILTGNPNYYRRFGFELSPSNCPSNEPEGNFMVKPLSAEQPAGEFAFHKTFYGDA